MSPRETAPEKPAERRSTARVVGIVLAATLAILATIGSLVVWAFLDSTDYFDHEFVVRNTGDVALTDVVLLAERDWVDGAAPEVLERIDALAPGETVHVEFDRSPSFSLGVRFVGPDGPHVQHDVHYIDGDEWGDRDVELRTE